MKTMLPFTLAVLLGATALAAETPTPKPAGQKPSSPAIKAQPQTVADSPLVAAARKSSRKGKKATTVITNSTVKDRAAGAHITTAKIAPPMPYIAPAATEEKAKVVSAAEPAAKAEPKMPLEQRHAEAVEGIDDEYSDMDPAQAERIAAQTARELEKRPEPAPEKPPHR